MTHGLGLNPVVVCWQLTAKLGKPKCCLMVQSVSIIFKLQFCIDDNQTWKFSGLARFGDKFQAYISEWWLSYLLWSMTVYLLVACLIRAPANMIWFNCHLMAPSHYLNLCCYDFSHNGVCKLFLQSVLRNLFTWEKRKSKSVVEKLAYFFFRLGESCSHVGGSPFQGGDG